MPETNSIVSVENVVASVDQKMDLNEITINVR
jgi:TATA-box binding protein (TBP) (component of TFIID and TFIIIB)